MVARALVVGVGNFPEPDESEDSQAAGIKQLGPLVSVEKAVRAVASALHRAGVDTDGDPLLEVDRDVFYGRWRGLRQSPGPGEPMIVHFAGHGIQGRDGSLYLATGGAAAEDEFLDDSCVAFANLLSAAENGSRPVLFLLDVCGAGQALVQQQMQDLAAQRPQDRARNAWIIGACTNDAATYGARFSSAVATVLHQLADGTFDLTPAVEYVPVDTLSAAIDRELARADQIAARPGQTVVRTPQIEASAEPQPFLRNPAHRPGSPIALLEGMDPRLREFAHACSPGLDPLHFATRAAGNPRADVIHFSGRASALARVEQWINTVETADTTPGRLLVITGGPGSGKSALLGVVSCLTHPQLAPCALVSVTPYEPSVLDPAVASSRSTPASSASSRSSARSTISSSFSASAPAPDQCRVPAASNAVLQRKSSTWWKS